MIVFCQILSYFEIDFPGIVIHAEGNSSDQQTFAKQFR